MLFSQIIEIGNYTSYLIQFLVSSTIGIKWNSINHKEILQIQSLNNFHDSFAHITYNRMMKKEVIVIFKNSKFYLL